MAKDALAPVRAMIGERLLEIRRHGERLWPLDIHARLDAIRGLAADNGLHALEGVARRSAQLALLPGHRVNTRCCVEHLEVALASRSATDSPVILAALAARLN